MKKIEENLDIDVYIKAFKDGYAGVDSALTKKQIQTLGQAYEKRKNRRSHSKTTTSCRYQ